MKRLAILILILTILVLTIPTAQAAGLDYTALKTEYIKNHPGQAIIPFPWEPSTSIRVLPFNYEIPAVPGNSFSISACRNEFESASFIINAQKDLSGITISVPNLYNAQGNSIPADAINVRLVKVWYQADEDDLLIHNPGQRYLAPELLLKDDSLVNVNYVTKTNYLKVTINGIEQYIDISNSIGTFPSNAQIHDTPSLQPFSLKTNENKQIWLTVHVPNNTPAGDYYGDITLATSSQAPVRMNFCVKVLPFELEPSPIEYGIFYWGLLPATASEKQNVGITDRFKTPEQYAIELQNMKDHGVLYPTIYNWYSDYNPNNQMLRLALSLRQQTGFPTDHIYVLSLDTGNSANINDLTKLKHDVNDWKNITSQYGYREVFSYGIDEARGDVLRSERPAWQTVHTAGAKVFVAVSDNADAVNIVGDLLDVAVFAGPLDTSQAAKWHSYGKRIFSYANPQIGLENPEIYRENYGFALWNAGYDGAMNFAYQQHFGQSIWNDFDSQSRIWRDHVFAYPTSNGVIDTIQWEGWREGVDDTRYLASLKKHEGSYTSGRAIITNSLSKGEDMATIRKKVINQILISHTSSSTPTPTKTPTPSITVTSPNGGETLKRGTSQLTSQTITWDYTGSPGSTVKIVLSKGGTDVGTIASSVPIGSGGKGSYTWWMSLSGMTGSDFKVSIQSISQPTIKDTSNNYFTITSGTSAPSITVTAPNGGETLKRGTSQLTSQTITWDYTGSPGSTVKIVLSKGGTDVGTIASSVPIGSGGKGSYTWWMSLSGMTGSDFKVSIQSISQSTIKDTSNNYFTITS